MLIEGQDNNTIPGLVVANTFQNGRKEGMLDNWRKDHPIQEYIERASKVVGGDIATDWRKQVALVVFSVGVYFALRQVLKDKKPEVIIGHSIGEASSMVQGGMVGFEEMVETMNQREIICASTRPVEILKTRGMAALLRMPVSEAMLRLSNVKPEEFGVWIANINSEAQLVFSGVISGIDDLYETYFKDGNGILRHLPLSGAYHSGDMIEEHERFALVVSRNLTDVKEPDGKISSPMLKALTGQSWVKRAEDGIRVIANQLITPVHHLQSWRDDINPNIRPRTVLAIDPSGTFGGVIKPNLGSDVSIITISDQESFDNAVERLEALS